MTYPHAIRLVLLLAGLLALLPATACFSGLVGIPTTDLVSPCEYSVIAQFDGVVPGHTVDTYLLDTEFGLTDRFEAGLDYDFSAGATTRALFNAKYVPPVEDGALPYAVGVFNVGRHVKASPYIVVSPDTALARLHAGAIILDGTPQAMFGADRALGRYTLMADYTTGAASYATVGVYTDLTERVNLLAGAYFPNAGGETLFTVQLGFCGPFRACPKD